jgi:hypothetical protein
MSGWEELLFVFAVAVACSPVAVLMVACVMLLRGMRASGDGGWRPTRSGETLAIPTSSLPDATAQLWASWAEHERLMREGE